jgi:hypothetical protein
MPRVQIPEIDSVPKRQEPSEKGSSQEFQHGSGENTEILGYFIAGVVRA